MRTVFLAEKFSVLNIQVSNEQNAEFKEHTINKAYNWLYSHDLFLT